MFEGDKCRVGGERDRYPAHSSRHSPSQVIHTIEALAFFYILFKKVVAGKRLLQQRWRGGSHHRWWTIQGGGVGDGEAAVQVEAGAGHERPPHLGS